MIIILLICVGLFYLVQNAVYYKCWDKGLSIEMKFEQNAVYEGEIASLREVITNAKKLPIPVLEVAFELNRNMIYLNSENTVVTDQSYKRDFYVLYSWQRITRTLDFYCKKRGYYEINNADIRSMSLLMDRKFFRKDKQNSYLYVYPKRIPTERIDIPFNKIMGNILTKRYIYEDPFQFQGIREYQLSDPMNRINWKASARSNDYMVNVYGYTAMVSVCIFVDVEDKMILKYDSLLEESIRIASSLASRLIRAGIDVELISNGKDLLSENEIVVEKGNGVNHANIINRNLARMDLSHEVSSIVPYIKKHQLEDEDNNKVYVLISKNQNQVLQSIYEIINKQSEFMWIVPVHNDMDRMVRSGTGLEVILWEVDR
ncbi:MAG: DUF58 domain-containing protein [Clostridiales bacterium]|nr:DUF58 domain-containing protein [Clostridiales bacterium]